MKLDAIFQMLQQWFPLSLAEEWDNVGMLLGDHGTEVNRVMTCLTVTSETADEAIREAVDLIVAHHPIMFRPVQRLTADGPNAVVLRLARAGISVYSPHTAFDSAAGGINDQIAELLGLEHVHPLTKAKSPQQYKIVVFLPEEDLERVSSAMFRAGAGVIGEYTECGYRTTGTGTFLGSERSNPSIGQRGRREEVSEYRLETVVQAGKLSAAIEVIRATHSYEEPAFDVYPLQAMNEDTGTGRVGSLPEPMSVSALADKTKGLLHASHVSYVGAETACRTVAIGCGAADSLLDVAHDAGCHVLLTGEVRFHGCLRAQESGIGLILAGHYATERFAVQTLSRRIQDQWPELSVFVSQSESDPIQHVP